MPKTCLVQLGRYGDILNILPVAKDIAEQEGGRVAMLVCPQFLDLMDGVSYVFPVQWDGDMMQPHRAAEVIAPRYERTIVSQVADNSKARQRICEAYNMESWRYAGYLDRWSDPTLGLHLDRRSHAREQALIESYRLTGKPYILVNDKSISSPFLIGDRMIDDLRRKFGRDVIIVDMKVIKAVPFHDMLGLLDNAIALVTVDTATLHLAAASIVPVIALISDTDNNLWLGTKPRCNVALSLRYREYDARITEIHRVIQQILNDRNRASQGRVNIPVTLIGVDNFTPGMTLQAMWFSMRHVGLEASVLVTRTKPVLPGTDRRGVIVREIIEGRERVDRERFLITSLHTCFETSHAIHMEADARIANPSAWDQSWLQYDYIGAPWPWPFEQPGFPPCTAANCVGNLGFSLLSRRFCEAVSSIAKPTEVEARLSDVYMCRTLRPQLEEMGIRFAPEGVAAKFSCEDKYYSGQFGWHGKGTAEINGFRL